MNQRTIVDNANRVGDILEQVQILNGLITFQYEHNAPLSSISQYEFIRATFLEELTELFRFFGLNLENGLTPKKYK